MSSISLIWAMAENRVIGVDNRLPWRLPSDLQRFKFLTAGKPIIMGRKTYESIGRPLPSRTNIVLTKKYMLLPISGLVTATSVGDALRIARNCTHEDQEIFVIGGSEVYNQFLPYADKLYVTSVNAAVEGDAFFPEYNEDEWEKLAASSTDTVRHVADSHEYTFSIYQRINPN